MKNVIKYEKGIFTSLFLGLSLLLFTSTAYAEEAEHRIAQIKKLNYLVEQVSGEKVGDLILVLDLEL